MQFRLFHEADPLCLLPSTSGLLQNIECNARPNIRCHSYPSRCLKCDYSTLAALLEQNFAFLFTKERAELQQQVVK